MGINLFRNLFSICCMVLYFCCDNALAAKWEVTPTITADYIYTDNINLSTNNKTGDAVFALTPGISLSGKGGHVELEGSYNLQVIRYRDNNEADDEYHSGNLSANFKIVPETFNILTDARYGQQAISLTSSPVPPNNVPITTNRTNAFVYSVMPVYRTRVGGNTIFQADYRYEGVKYDSNAIADQDVNNSVTHVGLNSINQGRFNWLLNYTEKRFDLSGIQNDKYTKSEVSLRYSLTPRFTLIATGGDENNDISGSMLGTGDTYWGLGFAWQPGPRTSVELIRGERFFGKYTAATISQRWKRGNFSLAYEESISTTSSIQAETGLLPGFPVLPTTNELVLQKALHATLSGKTSKTEFGVTVDGREITYQTTLEREDYNTYELFWRWNISPKSTISLSGGKQIIDFITVDQENQLSNKDIIFDHAFGTRANAALQYSRYENQTTSGLNEYKSNFYSLNITITFR